MVGPATTNNKNNTASNSEASHQKKKRKHDERKLAAKKRKKESKRKNDNNDDDEKKRPIKEIWSKSKRKRMRLLKSKQNKQQLTQSDGNDKQMESTATTRTTMDRKDDNNDSKEQNISSSLKSNDSNNKNEKEEQNNNHNKKQMTGKSSTLQESYAARLTGSRFRILNEELYTTTSNTAWERFSKQPELFEQYHEGFRHQVSSWPSNPVDVVVRWLLKMTDKHVTTSGRNQMIVADFGCGDAELAKRLLKVRRSSNNNNENNNKKKKKKKQKEHEEEDQEELEETGCKKEICPFQIHSFDLVAKSDLVTACDMANVPLQDKTVDVVIFCLALMGTNVTDFLVEAHRVLKDDGQVKIAEVRSRFESSTSTNTNTNNHGRHKQQQQHQDHLEEFIQQLAKLGFDCQSVDRSNKMFVLMELTKNGKKPDKNVTVNIKPCIYKRR